MLPLGVSTASAQTIQDINNATRQSEQIQREQELRRYEQQQRDERSAKPSTTLQVAPPETAPAVQNQTCRDIKVIEIKNASLLSARTKKKLIGPYVNRCLGVNEIQALLSDITKEYIDRGYATTRAYIPTQDLSTGTLQILVVEGKVGSVQHGDEKAGENVVSVDYLDDNVVSLDHVESNGVILGNAFPGVEGDVLKLADLEQGIDQLNRLQSNHVTMDIQPGKQPGESKVIINNQRTKPWHVNATLDDYGTRSTGRSQTSVTASLDNPIGVNEFISYTRRESLPLRDNFVNSMSNNVFLSVPYGYTTLSAGYSDSDYSSLLNTPGGVSLRLTGDSYTVYGKIENNIYRFHNDRVNISSTLSSKTFNNYLAGQKLAVSSRRLSVVDADVNYSTDLAGGFVNMGAGISRGLPIFNALEDLPGIPKGEVPHAIFTKYRATLGYTRPFMLANQNMAFSTQAAGQIADRALYGSEQLSIGSIYTVRGFYESSLANDHGAYMRNDLSLTRQVGYIADGVPVLLRPYLGLDVGYVSGKVTGSARGTMAGAAAGFSIIAGRWFFDLYSSRALHRPNNIRSEGFMSFGRMSVTF